MPTETLKPLPEMPEEGQKAVDADSLLAAEKAGELKSSAEHVPFSVRFGFRPVLQLWWFKVKHRIVLRIRRALGVESDFHIISEYLSHHERLINGQRIDYDAFIESWNTLRKVDRRYFQNTDNRLNEYEHHNDQLKHTANALRKRRPELFNSSDQ